MYPIFHLQKLPHINSQLFLPFDEAFGDVLGHLIRRRVLVEIPGEAFDSHVAAVGHQLGDGVVRFVYNEFKGSYVPQKTRFVKKK